MTDNSSNEKIDKPKEVDLVQLLKIIWEDRNLIIRLTVIISLFGIFLATFSKKEYTTSSVFVQLSAAPGTSSSGLSGLASLAGINVTSSQTEGLPPSLYPKIVSSSEFKKKLMEINISIQGVQDSVTYAEYYRSYYRPSFVSILKKYTIGLPGVILGAGSKETENQNIQSSEGEGFSFLSPDEIEHFERLEKQLVLDVNEKEASIRLSFTMPEPVMTAQMVTAATRILQNEIVAFKIDKAKQQLTFIEERYAEKKNEFEDVQDRIARYRDSNQGIVTATARNELDRLQAEYNLAFNVFNDLAQQLEKARFDVKKDTPVLSIIQEAIVPFHKSAPKRIQYFLISVFLGLGLGTGLVLMKYILGKIWKELA